MKTTWWIVIELMEDVDNEEAIISETYEWGPFSNEQDAGKAQELLKDTYAGDNVTSTLEERT